MISDAFSISVVRRQSPIGEYLASKEWASMQVARHCCDPWPERCISLDMRWRAWPRAGELRSQSAQLELLKRFLDKLRICSWVWVIFQPSYLHDASSTFFSYGKCISQCSVQKIFFEISSNYEKCVQSCRFMNESAVFQLFLQLHLPRGVNRAACRAQCFHLVVLQRSEAVYGTCWSAGRTRLPRFRCPTRTLVGPSALLDLRIYLVVFYSKTS